MSRAIRCLLIVTTALAVPAIAEGQTPAAAQKPAATQKPAGPGRGKEFVLGGSGHNAGVINPPAANKHGFWTNTKQSDDAAKWLETATRHEGSWWPWWTKWLYRKGSKKPVPARQPKDVIEPAPGRYVMMP